MVNNYDITYLNGEHTEKGTPLTSHCTVNNIDILEIYHFRKHKIIYEILRILNPPPQKNIYIKNDRVVYNMWRLHKYEEL